MLGLDSPFLTVPCTQYRGCVSYSEGDVVLGFRRQEQIHILEGACQSEKHLPTPQKQQTVSFTVHGSPRAPLGGHGPE